MFVFDLCGIYHLVTEYDQVSTVQCIMLFCAELSALYSDVKST